MISIIIPAYNAQAYLRECLESVLAQSYTEWEAIIVNDGSTDSTLEIALSYAALDPRFRVITTENRGLSCARNAGLEVVQGEWVTYLDSDDALAENALDVLIRNADGVDVVVGILSREKLDHDKCAVQTVLLSGCKALADGLYQTGMCTSACGKLFRSDLIKEVRFPEGMYYEDLMYCCNVFRLAKSVNLISGTVYFYRDNPHSFINTFTHKRIDVLEITAEIERLCAGDPELLRAARDRRLSANFNIYGLLSVHDREGRYSEIRDRCWQLIKDYRLDSLRNPRVRLKNKLGILVSYLGKAVMAHISKIVY